MSFFELPAWQPPSDYRRPAWLRSPEGTLPRIVPVELLLARTDTHAVLVDGLLVYPTGFDFDVAVRLRPGRPRQHHHHDDFWDDGFRLELRFADGRTASNDPRRWPRTVETEEPDPPLLSQSGGGSGNRAGWQFHHWVWGLPPPGPLTFACQWPAQQLPPSQAEMDAGLVLEAAERARTVWPDEVPP
jgi:hypothetical protein